MRSSASPRAVRSRIGVVIVSRRLAVSARPSSPGIITSSTIRSNSSPSSSARAWRASRAGVTHEAVARQELLQQRPQAVVVVDDETCACVSGAAAHGRAFSSQLEHALAHLGVDHLLEHLAEAVDRLRPGGGEGRAHPPALGGGELLLEGVAGGRQAEVAVAAVVEADSALDEAVVDELAQHAVEALLGHAEEVEQLVHGEPGPAVDEVDRTVVGPPVLRAPRMRSGSAVKPR